MEFRDNGDLVLAGIITVRQHWRLFIALTLLFVLYALRILFSPTDLVRAEARIKVHQDYTLIAIDAARSQGVVPAERRYDKTILLGALAPTSTAALARLADAITAVEVEVGKPDRSGLEALGFQASRIEQQLQFLQLQLVGIDAMGCYLPWAALGNGNDGLVQIGVSLAALNKTLDRFGSRANTEIHLVEAPHVASGSAKPRALLRLLGGWLVVCLLVGVLIHAWRRLQGAWREAGRG